MKTQIAQKWLDKKYPKEKRVNIKELNISDKCLEGSLKLESFNNLEKLDCSNNLITKLDLTSCKAEKLIKLDVSNNDFENQDLSCFSRFVNLKKLYLGTTKIKNINRGIYNRFNGSLELLKDLVELEKLAISNTNIDSGLEDLPKGLEMVYCANYLGDNIGCEKIKKKTWIK